MRYFLNGTTLAGLEREMMRMPSYRPRGGGEMILCQFRYKPEDVDCRNCLAYQRRRCWEVTCPYLLERLEAGTATLPELLSKMFGSWDRIDFGAVRLDRVGIKEYTLYRAAKGIYQGRLGVTAEELADNTLVPDDTLLLIISAALVARFGPEVMRIGRTEK